MRAAFSLQLFQVIVICRRLPRRAFRLDRRHQQMLLAISPDHVVPEQQLTVVTPGLAMQSGQDDGIELQPFRLMDCHHLHGITRRIRRGKEFSGFGRKVFGVQ